MRKGGGTSACGRSRPARAPYTTSISVGINLGAERPRCHERWAQGMCLALLPRPGSRAGGRATGQQKSSGCSAVHDRDIDAAKSILVVGCGRLAGGNPNCHGLGILVLHACRSSHRVRTRGASTSREFPCIRESLQGGAVLVRIDAPDEITSLFGVCNSGCRSCPISGLCVGLACI